MRASYKHASSIQYMIGGECSTRSSYLGKKTEIYFNLFCSKGLLCWLFNNERQPVGSNPQSISTVFPGLPDKIDAAFIWSGNAKLYFISGRQILYHTLRVSCTGISAITTSPSTITTTTMLSINSSI